MKDARVKPAIVIALILLLVTLVYIPYAYQKQKQYLKDVCSEEGVKNSIFSLTQEYTEEQRNKMYPIVKIDLMKEGLCPWEMITQSQK